MKPCTCVVGLLLASAIQGNSSAKACNVPVFRYALERWRPDRYEVVLFHKGPLTEQDRALLRPLEEQQDKDLGNLALRTVDVSQRHAAADQELLAAHANAALPWLVVQYPKQLRIPVPVWAGPLAEQEVKNLIDSPLRKELTKRLTDGQTAVWILLESGQAEKDDAAAAMLQAELKKLEQELKLPELGDNPDDTLLAGTPLRVAFSVLRLSRSKSEQALVAMLLNSESDLPDRTDAMVFPVFGRGRALYGLVGAGITAENIFHSASFLVGPCSCQVKELNPGFDLLLAADWSALLSQNGAALDASDPAAPLASEKAVLVPIPSGGHASDPAIDAIGQSAAAAPNSRWMMMLTGGIVVVVLAIVFLIGGRRG